MSRSRRIGRLASTLAIALAAACGAPLLAQDTPEMLAAMRGMLPPIPAEVPERDALPDAVRQSLPTVIVQSHRWSEQPAARFVMMQGRRIDEGGVVDRDLWLREVRPDGVVLQYRDVFFFQRR